MTINSFNRKFPTAVTYIFFCVPFFSIMSLDVYLVSYLFYYYQVVIGIPAFLIIIPTGIIRLIFPFLQPLLGSISDRNYSFTRNKGRRFLWIMIFGFQIPIFFVLLFWIPALDVLIFFIIFTTFYMLYNVIFSLFTSNYSALLLNKFRNPKERLLIGVVTEFISTIGIFIIWIFAPLFINYGDPSSFQILAIPIAIVFAVTLSLGIFGLLEEKELIDTYFSSNQAPKKGFLRDMFKGFAIFKRKNFIVLLFRWIAFGLFNYLFLSGLFYYAVYVLGAPYFIASIFSMGYIIWSLIALPLSFLLSYFIGHLRVSIISGFVMGATLLPFLFINDIFISIILISIIGFSFGLGAGSLIPLVGDVLDEHANANRRRSEGVSYGILNMFGGLTVILGSFITSFVYTLTGFYSGWGPQPPSAILGIRILNTTIPGILIIIVMILFTVLYDLKPEKTEAIRMELKELEL